MATSRKTGGQAKAGSNATDNVLTAPPSADALKQAFAAGKIPVEGNFHDLIDLADTGAHLAAGDGLVLGTDGNLKVQAIAANGLEVSASGVAVKVDNAKGIVVGADGVGVKGNAARSIEVNADGVAVKADVGRAIKADVNGVGVVAGIGIAVGANVAVKPKANGGIDVSVDGIAVKIESNKGIGVTAAGLKVIAGNGIAVTPSVIVVPGQGIAVTGSGVGVKPILAKFYDGDTLSGSIDISAFEQDNIVLKFDKAAFGFKQTVSHKMLTLKGMANPVGMIAMFAGDVAPPGWKVCDGSGNTPNLKSQFIKDEARSKDGPERYSLTYIMLTDNERDEADSLDASA